jgi:hypothetical protein
MIPSSFFSHLHHWTHTNELVLCLLIRCWSSDLLLGWCEHSFILNKIRSTNSTCLQPLDTYFISIRRQRMSLRGPNRIFNSSNQLMKYSFDISATTFDYRHTPLHSVTWTCFEQYCLTSAWHLVLQDLSLTMKCNWQHLQKYDVNLYIYIHVYSLLRLSLSSLLSKDLIVVCSFKYQSDKNEEVIIVNL